MSAFTAWARDAGLRAVKTAAQTAVAMLGVDQTGWLHADLADIGLTALFAAAVSVLHNLAALKIDQPGNEVASALPAQEG